MAESPDEGARGIEAGASADAGDGPSEELRRAVEEKYDFDDFTPADMEEMTAAEWEAVFDPGTWITGTELLDRVEADLKAKVKRRQVFAVVERIESDGEDRVLAYSDTGYAIVHPDGSVEGEGDVRRDVEPAVALCSMDDYDVPEMPDDDELLPDPSTVGEGSSELGNRLVQVVAGVQLLAGAVLLVSPLFVGPGGSGSVLVTTVAGLGFVLVGVFLLLLVANARLSDRFRAEEYRERLRAAGVGTDERPDFLPVDDDDDAAEPTGS